MQIGSSSDAATEAATAAAGEAATETEADGRLADISSVALERLRDILAMPGAAPGVKLPTERDLSTQLGVGRRAIRRALEVLEAEGLVWRRHGAGTFTGPPPMARNMLDGTVTAGPATLLNVIEARLALEPSLARIAAVRAAPDVLVRIAACIARIEVAQDVDSADLWDSALHREIAQATGNPLLLALFDRINAWRHDDGIRRLRMGVRSKTGTGHAQKDHRRILAAMQAGDGAAAAQAMRDHLTDLHTIFMRHSQEETTGYDD